MNTGLLKKIIYYRYVYLLLLPGFLFFAIFSYGPMYGVLLAFKELNWSKGILGSPWVGLDNFMTFLKQEQFWKAFCNTLVIAFGRLVLEFPVPIILAILLNELRAQRFKRFVQSVMYFPFFISWVVMSSLMFNLFSVDRGAVNGLMELIGLQRQPFLTDSTSFFILIFVTDLWKTMGYSSILYLAALTSIDVQLYDAASIDGANRLQRIWYIILPGISSTIFTVLILVVGNMLNAGFDQIFNIRNSAVLDIAEIIDTYVYDQALKLGQYGVATAAGLFKSVINAILLISVNQIVIKTNGTSLYEK